MRTLSRHIKTANVVIVLGLAVLVFTLSCGVVSPLDDDDGDLSLRHGPQWACNSPVPKPYGPSGPKRDPACCCDEDCDTDPETGETDCHCVDDTCDECRYYEWEQEYGPGGSLLRGEPPYDGPPFPSPTPFNWDGQEYVFGQAVKLDEGFFVEVTTQVGDRHPDDPERQLFFLHLVWTNDTRSEDGQPLTHGVNYRRQVNLRAVTTPDGGTLTDTWRPSPDARQLAGMDTLPDTIPPGKSQVSIPILAPAGTPYMAELTFRTGADSRWPEDAPTADATTLPDDVNPPDRARTEMTLRFVNETYQDMGHAGGMCGSGSAMGNWGSGDNWGVNPTLFADSPPLLARAAALAVAQQGSPYVWGAVGPGQYDCSGLVLWVYGQLGVDFWQLNARTAAAQYAALTHVSSAQVLPGDPVYFAGGGRAVGHAGFYVGDVTGDGTPDMMHCATPDLGCIVDNNFMAKGYWQRTFVGYATVRGVTGLDLNSAGSGE